MNFPLCPLFQYQALRFQWYCNSDVSGQMVAIYSWGEHGIVYKLIKSLSCTPETNVTLCVTYVQKKRKSVPSNKHIQYCFVKSSDKCVFVIVMFWNCLEGYIWGSLFSLLLLAPASVLFLHQHYHLPKVFLVDCYYSILGILA